MEIRPPWKQPPRISNLFRVQIVERNRTYEAVVVAADRLGRARVAGADADNVDRGAVQADEGVHVLDDNAQETEDRGGRGRVGLSSSVSIDCTAQVKRGIVPW